MYIIKWHNTVYNLEHMMTFLMLCIVFQVFRGLPCGSAGKESAFNAEDLGSIPGLKRSPGEGNGYPLQCSGLENSTDCIVRGVTELDTTE